jgi:hypothetical protein
MLLEVGESQMFPTRSGRSRRCPGLGISPTAGRLLGPRRGGVEEDEAVAGVERDAVPDLLDESGAGGVAEEADLWWSSVACTALHSAQLPLNQKKKNIHLHV